MKIKGGKFLITGGASQIGAHITEQLLAADAREVVLFDNFSLGTPEGIDDLVRNPRVKFMRGDILRANELFDGLEGVNGVFAAAGFLTLPLTQNPNLGVAVNVQGMLNVFDACRYRNVEKVIFSSSIAVYGEPGDDIIDEIDALDMEQAATGRGAVCGVEDHGREFRQALSRPVRREIGLATLLFGVWRAPAPSRGQLGLHRRHL